MCVALIGGMDRLKRNYITEAKKLWIDLGVFTKPEIGMAFKIRNVDALIIFTNKVSHNDKKGGDEHNEEGKEYTDIHV